MLTKVNLSDHRGKPIIEALVDSLWDNYDVDNQGELTRDETKRFMMDISREANKEMVGQDFTAVFKEIDTNRNGTIDRDEMVVFLDKLVQRTK